MSMETDISWQLLRGIVRDWAGTSAELAEVTTLRGGSIHMTLALTTKSGQKAVLKVTPYRVDRGYLDEAHQLNLLRSVGMPTPEVYACRMGTLDSPNSYILMQHVDGMNLAEARKSAGPEQYEQLQVELAEMTLAMHARRSSHYWRVTDTPHQQYDHWPTFYREMYDPIWQEAQRSGLVPIKARRQIARVHERLDRLLVHDDSPRLVHWDLWSGNILACPGADGRWRISAILDPNCKYAHAEAELAYLELFQTITPAFLRVYHESRKPPADYHQVRKLIYQLYPLIDDVTLHGEQYVKPLLAQLEKVATLV